MILALLAILLHLCLWAIFKFLLKILGNNHFHLYLIMIKDRWDCEWECRQKLTPMNFGAWVDYSTNASLNLRTIGRHRDPLGVKLELDIWSLSAAIPLFRHMWLMRRAACCTSVSLPSATGGRPRLRRRLPFHNSVAEWKCIKIPSSSFDAFDIRHMACMRTYVGQKLLIKEYRDTQWRAEILGTLNPTPVRGRDTRTCNLTHRYCIPRLK